MARTGLYRSEVKKARDSLIAQGRNPSVDTVRVELGNTGSKTTIHKYLKELEEEDGGAGAPRASISDALQDLVERLAARLHEEAAAEVDATRQTFNAKSAECDSALLAAKHESASMLDRLRELEGVLGHQDAALAAARETLHRESIARNVAEQLAAGLKERLLENEAHLHSLEEKHQHARDALEHYRQSVKEQRDQDQSRHELQVQQFQAELRQLQQSVVVKQEEVTRLNQEGATLVSELSHARQALFDQQSIGRQQEKRIEGLQAEERRAAALEARLADKIAQEQSLVVRLDSATGQIGGMTEKVRDLEISLASAQSALAAQQDVMAELRTFLINREPKGALPTSAAS